MSEKHSNAEFASLVSLFTSGATLLCCALPALLVTIGLGSAVAGLVAGIPQIVWFSEHKVLVFSVSGLILLLTGLTRRSASKQSCPADQRQAQACGQMKKMSGILYGTAIMLYMVGIFFAFFIKYII